MILRVGIFINSTNKTPKSTVGNVSKWKKSWMCTQGFTHGENGGFHVGITGWLVEPILCEKEIPSGKRSHSWLEYHHV